MGVYFAIAALLLIVLWWTWLAAVVFWIGVYARITTFRATGLHRASVRILRDDGGLWRREDADYVQFGGYATPALAEQAARRAAVVVDRMTAQHFIACGWGIYWQVVGPEVQRAA